MMSIGRTFSSPLSYSSSSIRQIASPLSLALRSYVFGSRKRFSTRK
jgi:hypothetical protein